MKILAGSIKKGEIFEK